MRRIVRLVTISGGCLLLLAVGCGPKYPPQASMHERCQASGMPGLCEVIGNRVEADMAGEQAVTPSVISQPVPVYQQRPYVALPGVTGAVRTSIPGLYMHPDRHGGQLFTVQPLP